MDIPLTVPDCQKTSSPNFYIYTAYIIAMISFTANTMCAFLIFFYSSKSMTSYKCHLLYNHFLTTMTSLIYSILVVPVILSPLPIGYSAGLFHKIGIPTETSFWIVMFFVIQITVSVLFIFFNRLQLSLPKKHKLKLASGYYWLIFALYSWLNVFFFVSLTNADTKVSPDVVPPCLLQHFNINNLFFFELHKFFVPFATFLVYNFILNIIFASSSIYYIVKNTELSEEVKNNHKKKVVHLLLQMFLPILLVIIPVSIICLSVSYVEEANHQVITEVCSIMICLYDLGYVLSIIIFNRCYRQAIAVQMLDKKHARRQILLFSQLLIIFSIAAAVALYFSIGHGSHNTYKVERNVREETKVFYEFPDVKRSSIDDGFNKAAAKKWDFFVASAYYYPKSKSLGNNSIALVLSGHWTNRVKSINLTVSNGNETKTVELGLKKALENVSVLCTWQTYMATIPTGIDNLQEITTTSGGAVMNIPFKTAVYQKYDVVTCVAPLFTAEQWQEMLFALHIYRQFGSHPHFYVRSIVKEVYDVLRFYEKEGYLTVQPWLRLAMSTVSSRLYNPNKAVEFRAQDLAQTDCLLQYKESAEFIMMVDMDDVLIPKQGRTYLEEFKSIFSADPTVEYFRYQKWNAEYTITRNPELFMVDKMISSLKYTKNTEYGKYVVMPRLANSSWIHWPTGSKEMQWRNLTAKFSTLTHLKGMTVDDDFFICDNETSVPNYNLTILATNPWDTREMKTTEVMSEIDLESIQNEFIRMRSLEGMEQAWSKLPRTPFYGPLISNCYKKVYYNLGSWKDFVCTNPDKCDLPTEPGVMCVNARGRYSSIVGDDNINYHFATEGYFKVEDGCVP